MSAVSTIRDAAKLYLAQGFPLVPINPQKGEPAKGPTIKGWRDNPLTPASDLSILGENWNIGLLLTKLSDIDVDLSELCQIARRRLPETHFCYGRASKPFSHYVYSIPNNKNKTFTDIGKPGEQKMIVEIRHGGQQSLIPPSIHPSGEHYEFANGHQPQAAVWTAAECLVAVGELAALGLLSRYWQRGIINDTALALAGALARNGWKWPRAERFFEDLAELTGDRKSIERAKATFEKYRSSDRVTGVPTLETTLGRDVTAKLVDWLELDGQADERRVEAQQRRALESATEPSRATDAALDRDKFATQTLTDTGNAERLLSVYGDNLRYVPKWKKWLVWDETRWALDEKGNIRALVRSAIKQFGRDAIDEDSKIKTAFAMRSLNSKSITNAITEACDQRAVEPSELDSNRDLLNFKNGTLNLRTGDFYVHKRSDLITKRVESNYNPEAKCPEIEKFILRSVGAEQYPLLIRALGYSITGHTSEKCTFVCYGPTNTGKTTLLNLLSDCFFADYSTLIMADSLVPRRNQDANTLSDLADLCGRRFVQTSETREGQRLDEATLKRITPGQGLIRATRKYEVPFNFSATHKLWVDTNHELVITGTGDDIWARIIPFAFGPEVPDGEIDKELPAKLRAEIEGFFALVSREAKRWYTAGLGKLPEKVTDTRSSWKTNSDRVTRFIEECCDLDKDLADRGRRIMPRPLYRAYSAWERDGGEYATTETMFFRRLKEMMPKFGISKPDKERHYLGVDLKQHVAAWVDREVES